jgi:hypothetical protein
MDMCQWLTAISKHVERDRPVTAWLEEPVALALAEGRTFIPGMSEGLFRLGVEHTIRHGFLDDVLRINHGGGWTEHVLAFRLPQQVTR